MRSIKELLQIILDHVDQVRHTEGLCSLASQLYNDVEIIQEEEDVIRKYFGQNLPEHKYKGVYLTDELLYSWPPGKVEPRRQWLEEQIKKLKE